MMGFTTSIIEEAITKKGTLGQIGFITPSPPLFITISGAATVGTFVALAVTFYNASTGKMTARQVSKKQYWQQHSVQARCSPVPMHSLACLCLTKHFWVYDAMCHLLCATCNILP